MAIRIHAEKVLSNNGRVKKILVTDIEMLTAKELPVDYLFCNCVYKLDDVVVHLPKGVQNMDTLKILLKIGKSYRNSEFLRRLEIIDKCGNNLCKINKNWKGRMIFEI